MCACWSWDWLARCAEFLSEPWLLADWVRSIFKDGVLGAFVVEPLPLPFAFPLSLFAFCGFLGRAIESGVGGLAGIPGGRGRALMAVLTVMWLFCLIDVCGGDGTRFGMEMPMPPTGVMGAETLAGGGGSPGLPCELCGPCEKLPPGKRPPRPRAWLPPRPCQVLLWLLWLPWLLPWLLKPPRLC